jgi:hypothetical protein
MKQIFLASIILLIVSFGIKAQELIPYDTSKFEKEEVVNETQGNYQISERYKGGRHLIYDCRGQFFACVNIDSKETCQMLRGRSFEKNEEKLRCAPLKSFADKESCLKRQYEVIEEVHLKRFCFPNIKESY